MQFSSEANRKASMPRHRLVAHHDHRHNDCHSDRPAVAEPVKLSPGVRGVATRAPREMKIDGNLAEFKDAFATPVEYFHPDLRTRAAQFFTFGTTKPSTRAFGPSTKNRPTWPMTITSGKATRSNVFRYPPGQPSFRNIAWPTDPVGAVHCYWTGYENDQLQPRFCLRPNFLNQIAKIGCRSWGAQDRAWRRS